MHGIAAAVKVTHLRAVAYGRKLFKRIDGMTPARFDCLYYLRRFVLTRSLHPVAVVATAARLSEDLGLHRTTVSKLLKRLEQLGWIQRVPHPGDRRSKGVELTQQGSRRISHAMRIVFRRKRLRRVYERLFRYIGEVGPE